MTENIQMIDNVQMTDNRMTEKFMLSTNSELLQFRLACPGHGVRHVGFGET